MRLLAVAVAAGLAAGALTAGHAEPLRPPAKKRVVARSEYVPGTVVVHRGEDGRTRTKILVQKRSYLDGGTEVLPGDNIDSYRSSFLTHRATDALGPNVIFNPPGPIPDPFFLPGPNNPWPGFQY